MQTTQSPMAEFAVPDQEFLHTDEVDSRYAEPSAFAAATAGAVRASVELRGRRGGKLQR
jgi:hypothetical protein